MAKITNYLNNIKNAMFGKDVRDSIHDGIAGINEEVESTTSRQKQLEGTFDQLIINSGNSNAEIVAGRTNAEGKSFDTIGKRLDNTDSQIKEKANKNINGNYFNINDYSHLCYDVVIGEKTYQCWDNAFQQACNDLKNGRILFPSDRYYFNEPIIIPTNIIIYGDNWDNSILNCTPNIVDKTFITINNPSSGIHHLTISGNDNSNVLGLFINESKNIEIHDLAFIYFAKGSALDIDAMNLQLNNFKFWKCKTIKFNGSDNGFSNIMATSCLTLHLLGGNNRYQNVSVKGGDIVENWDYVDTYGIKMSGTRNQYNIIECQDAINHGILIDSLSASQCYNILSDANGSGKRKGLQLSNIIGIHVTGYSYDTVLHSISDNYTYPDNIKTQDIGLKVESTPERLILNHKTVRHDNKDIIITKNYQQVFKDNYYINYNITNEMNAQTIPATITKDTIDIVFGSYNDEQIYTQRLYWKLCQKTTIGYFKNGNFTYRDVTVTSNGITISDAKVYTKEGTNISAGSNNYVKIIRVIGYQNGIY